VDYQRNFEIGVQVKVTNAVGEVQESQQHKKRGIFKEWKEIAFRKWLSTTALRDGETTIEMKMERPVQSWDRQEQKH
jgi:hypothetical protein